MDIVAALRSVGELRKNVLATLKMKGFIEDFNMHAFLKTIAKETAKTVDHFQILRIRSGSVIVDVSVAEPLARLMWNLAEGKLEPTSFSGSFLFFHVFRLGVGIFLCPFFIFLL